jgi:abortive infection bacteriophage resistance protein
MKFAKQAIDLPGQLNKLKSRGLIVSDDAKALHQLQNIGYYRLAGYAYPFLDSPTRKVFKAGTTLDQILRLYDFDRTLRVLLLDLIERLEVTLRSRLVTETCLPWGAHWFMDAARFHPHFNHLKFIDQIEREMGVRYDRVTMLRILPAFHAETFVQHYYAKYGDPHLPPFWMTAEVLTLGSLSKLFKGIGSSVVKATIASPFGVPAKMFEGWLHGLAHLRNICAHHGRLWNRIFSIKPPIAHKHRGIMLSPNKLEGHLVVLVDALDVAHPGHSFRQDFKALLARYPEIDPIAMGFPSGWSTQPFWSK